MMSLPAKLRSQGYFLELGAPHTQTLLHVPPRSPKLDATAAPRVDVKLK